MYTNIDNERGLAAVKNAFLANPDPRRSDPHVLELLELSLKYNDFEFNGDTFLQISGTAMGKSSHLHMPTFLWQNGKPLPWPNAI